MATLYETLGVAQTATPDEIKSAYRKLAMQWHPDRNQGNPEATAKFKDISSAYEILSDENKRREYDFQQQNSQNFGPSVGGMHFNFNGNPFGPGGLDDFVSQIFGQHGFGHFRQPPRNRDVNLTMNVSLEDVYTGKQIPIQFTTPGGRRVELVIDLPKGIDTGTRIRYQGQGDHDNPNMPPGDLFINIQVSDHPRFTRIENTLECEVKIDAISAILGTRHTITTISGSKITITIPTGTQPGTKLRVHGAGMPIRQNPNAYGDLIVSVAINIPVNLTADNIALLQSIQSSRPLDNS
jgi:DnaJ-class molecular chaperone